MELDVALRKGFRLGDWGISPIEGLVSGAHGSCHLQPKTMDVLVCLAESQGEVVTRDELIARVWGENAVSDEPLTRCIHEIRRALGDDRGEPVYIKTIPKRGYQLLSPVTELPLEQQSPTSGDGLFWQVTRQRVLWVGAVYASLAWAFVELARYVELQLSAELAPPPWAMLALVVLVLLGFPVAVFFAWVRQIRLDEQGMPIEPQQNFPGILPLLCSRRGIDIVLVTLVIAVLAGFALDLLPGSAPRALEPDNPRVAVLPFEDAADQAGGNWLGNGIADNLRAGLGLKEGLTVIVPPENAEISGADPQQIGRLLDVEYVLQGFVVRGPETVRLRVRLTDALTGFELWQESFKPTDRRAH